MTETDTPQRTLADTLAPYKDWQRPFIAVEWLTERLVSRLERWAIVDLLKIIGSFSLVTGAISYLLSADDRARAALDQRKAKHYQAWQVLNSANGLVGSGGRLDALHDLVADSVPLDGVAIDSAWLVGVDLRNMKANNATARRANLSHAILSAANLGRARMPSANASYVCLNGATLVGSQLQQVAFRGSDIRGSLIVDSDLDGADLYRADLSWSLLYEVKLRPFGTTDGREPPDASRTDADRYYVNRFVLMRRGILAKDSAGSLDTPLSSELHRAYWSVQADRTRLFEAWPDTQYQFHVEPADLTGANLTGARIERSELRHAVLDSVDLAGASIRDSDLRGVRLRGAKHWNTIESLDGTFFYGSEDVPDGFLSFAVQKGAIVLVSASDTSRQVRSLRAAKLFLQSTRTPKRPTVNEHGDSLARTPCAVPKQEWPYGGRLAKLDWGRIGSLGTAARDSEPEAVGLHIWDLGSHTTQKDSAGHTSAIVETFIVENTDSLPLRPILEATAGVYTNCKYSNEDPLSTFVPMKRAQTAVALPPHSLRIVPFDFGRLPNEPPARCAGTRPGRPRVVGWSKPGDTSASKTLPPPAKTPTLR